MRRPGYDSLINHQCMSQGSLNPSREGVALILFSFLLQFTLPITRDLYVSPNEGVKVIW